MSRLVRQQRLDKNGRLVTRLVLAETGDSKAPLKAPAPSVPDPASQSAMAISDRLLQSSTDEDRVQLAKTLARGLTPFALQRVKEEIAGLSEDDEELFLDALDKMVSSNMGNSRTEREEGVMALLAAMPVISRLGDGEISGWTAVHIATGARYAAISQGVVFASRAGTLGSHAKAFRYLAWEYMVTGESRNRSFSETKEDAQWLDENFEQVALHRDTINERATVDRAFIDTLLKGSDATALESGIL